MNKCGNSGRNHCFSSWSISIDEPFPLHHIMMSGTRLTFDMVFFFGGSHINSCKNVK